MKPIPLFSDEVAVDARVGLSTEGVKYVGSKHKLLPQILALIDRVKPQSVLDGFSGTTRVSQALAQRGYKVIANDISVWSEVFANCYLLNNKPKTYYQPIIDHLNNTKPCDGWFSEHYGGIASDEKSSIGKDGFKKPWQIHNTRKLDAVRDEIEKLNLPFIEKSVLLTSLIHGLDEVDSTLGHFSSYLRHWSARSYKSLFLQVPNLLQVSPQHQVHRQNIFDLLPKIEVDLAYFDPPYGSNNHKMPASRVRYSGYYHLWTTICLNDRPQIFGKAKRRNDSSDSVSASVFEEFRQQEDGEVIAVEAIRRTLSEVKAKHILISYSSGGRATKQELINAIAENGELISAIEFDYRKNVMAQMSWTNEWTRREESPHQEFLFLMREGAATNSNLGAIK